MDGLLRAYDEQLRGDAELLGAARVERVGPVRIGLFAGGSALITARPPLGDAGPLVRSVLDRLRADPSVLAIEWKTRAHDDAPGLLEALEREGLAPGDPESIMIGEAAPLAAEVAMPAGVRVRAVSAVQDVRAASAMADRVFGDPVTEARVEDLLGRIERGAELWVAEVDGEVVATGRLEPVPGTAFAGLWGGATREDHRRRGVYRALTAERARSALRRGVRWLQSDSTEFSRPILERSGLRRVSTTTPWEWRRAGDATTGAST